MHQREEVFDLLENVRVLYCRWNRFAYIQHLYIGSRKVCLGRASVG